jgi:hypothetical protein
MATCEKVSLKLATLVKQVEKSLNFTSVPISTITRIDPEGFVKAEVEQACTGLGLRRGKGRGWQGEHLAKLASTVGKGVQYSITNALHPGTGWLSDSALVRSAAVGVRREGAVMAAA